MSYEKILKDFYCLLSLPASERANDPRNFLNKDYFKNCSPEETEKYFNYGAKLMQEYTKQKNIY